jgi:drug/metabolite transporter (DMT)-like permease
MAAEMPATSRLSDLTAGYLLGLAGVVIFGATLPMTRIALGGFDPLMIACGRAALASLVAGTALAVARVPLDRRQVPALLVAGLMLVFAFPAFSSLAMQTVSAAHGGIVLGVLPLLTAVFAALIGGERPGPAFWALGLTGAALVVGFTLLSADVDPGPGDLWLGLAAVSAAFGYVVSGRLSRAMPGWTVIAWALVLTAPLSVAATILAAPSSIHAPTAPEIAAFVYLAMGSMFGGFIFWNAGLARGGIARVGQVQLLQTFVTLALSALLLGERITSVMLAFAIAVAAVVWAGRKARVTPAPLPPGSANVPPPSGPAIRSGPESPQS